jgi:hypothetical protein
MPLTPTTEAARPDRSSSRLEKTLRRLEAQLACLSFAFEAIQQQDGVVAELGLGLGRTYDHLRWHLPDRQIFVFDRVNKAFADCQPPEGRLLLGEIADTFPAFAKQHAGQIVLANCDLGSANRDDNRAVIAMVEALVPHTLAPGAILMADLPIQPEGCDPLPLPAGVHAGSYFLFRKR